MNIEERNKKISESCKKTREKRRNQTCFVYKIKIDESSLKKEQKEALKMLFVEAKWLLNEAIASNNVFNYVPKKQVTHKDKDGNFKVSEFKYLSCQMKQSLLDQLKSNIKSLSTLKKKGKKVGKIKFRKEVKSIDLKQKNKTYKIINKRKIKIQNIPGEIRVNGLDQIYSKSNRIKYDLANAKLLNTPCGYYLAITLFKPKNRRKFIENKEIGVDFGVAKTVTLSDGRTFDLSVQETDRLKKLQRKLQKQKKGSKRRYKTVLLIRKEYQKIKNKKFDMANKIASEILKFEKIYVQNDNFENWKKLFGKKVNSSALRRLKNKIFPYATNILLRFESTSKYCSNCGKINKNFSLKNKIFSCDFCGNTKQRDLNAAENMIILSKKYKKNHNDSISLVGMERPEVTLVEIASDFSHETFMAKAAIDETRRFSLIENQEKNSGSFLDVIGQDKNS